MTYFIKVRTIILYLLICLPNFIAKAEDITLITENFPAESEHVSENSVGGICGEILTQALDAKKISFKIIWSRWKRAQLETISNVDKKSFIIPLTRNEEREKKYYWVSKLYDAETVFFVKKGNKKINSLREARGKKIGVLLDSSFELKMLNKKSGLNKRDIEAVPYDSINVKKVLSGEIDAWYNNLVGGFALIHSEKIDPNEFEYGNTIDSEENFIATTDATPKELINKVKNAIDSFKNTPQYFSIIKKYTGR